MTGETESAVALEPRRKPLQRRSQKREEAILLATEELIQADGFDALTTAHIALKAGVPIGTVYYLFPNKFAIVARLIEKCMGVVESILSEPYENMPWDEALDARIDALADHWHQERGLAQLWKALRVKPELVHINNAAMRQSIEENLNFVNYALPDTDYPQSVLIAKSIVYVSDRLLEESLELENEHDRLNLVNELKRMLRVYVGSFVRND